METGVKFASIRKFLSSMPIQELPRAASRLLSSSQVLTTPASLVKELLDNALDAKATSIDITVAANTLDKIEVRDNGHGIIPEDLSVIGKRGYTSKLRDLSDLKTLGGLSLGFRGVALASAVELGDVSITTRVEGEAVATAIKLDAYSGNVSQTSTSHPVGTTVCVTNFFSRLPVRKQTALKDAKKVVSRIKEILQSYALARLNVRLTLKVFKAAKCNWSFAPRANEGTREIISHVIGRETAAQCVEMTSTLFSPPQVDAGASCPGDNTLAPLNKRRSPEPPPQSSFIIQAFLPRRDADPTKINGGQYISIDSRPVSPARGSPKKIILIYKAIISAMLVNDASEKVKSPFLRLNIVCPAGSYDPNIEPAKDNVLFEDEEILLSLVGAWFRHFYGGGRVASIASNKASQTQDEGIARSINPVNSWLSQNNTFSCLKSEIDVPKASEMIDEDASSLYISNSEGSPDRDGTTRMGLPTSSEIPDTMPNIVQPRLGIDMSDNYSDEGGLDVEEQASAFCHIVAEDARNRPTSRNINQLNPWIIAKLTPPIIKKKNRESNLANPAGDLLRTWPPSTPFTPPTRRKYSVSRSYPAHQDLRSPDRRSYENIAIPDSSQISIEGWLRQSHESSPDKPEAPYDISLPSPENSDKGRTLLETGDTFMDRDISFDMLRPPPTIKAHVASRIRRNINGPFVSPLRDTHSAVAAATEVRVKSLPSRRPQSNTAVGMIVDGDAQNRANGDEGRPEVHEALDFERRKEVATRKLREQLRQSQSSTDVPATLGSERRMSLPHENNYHGAVAASEIDKTQYTNERMKRKGPDKTCLPDDDPRAYLMRRQKSLAARFEPPDMGRKLKRTKTMLLPLETIPHGTELHSSCQVVSTNIGLVRKAMLVLASYDQYTRSGNQGRELDMSAADIQTIEGKLRNYVKSLKDVRMSGEVDVVINLKGLQGRSVAHS